MAISLLSLYTNAVDASSNQNRVAAAAAESAVAILSEDPQSSNHAARLAWAQKTLIDPTAMGAKMVWAVLGDPNVQAEFPTPSDAVLRASVASLVAGFVNA